MAMTWRSGRALLLSGLFWYAGCVEGKILAPIVVDYDLQSVDPDLGQIAPTDKVEIPITPRWEMRDGACEGLTPKIETEKTLYDLASFNKDGQFRCIVSSELQIDLQELSDVQFEIISDLRDFVAYADVTGLQQLSCRHEQITLKLSDSSRIVSQFYFSGSIRAAEKLEQIYKVALDNKLQATGTTKKIELRIELSAEVWRYEDRAGGPLKIPLGGTWTLKDLRFIGRK